MPLYTCSAATSETKLALEKNVLSQTDTQTWDTDVLRANKKLFSSTLTQV